MTHSIAQSLEWGFETVGYFAKEGAERLIVFVHGFGGEALGTWGGMEATLVEHMNAASSDIVFYGYGSMRAQPTASAGLLRGFLDAAGENNASWLRALERAVPGSTPRTYDEILIVAHSLGAPVARRATLNALQAGSVWASAVRLVLFAPAHLGSLLHERRAELGVISGSIVGTLLALVGLRALSVEALKPGSRFLALLERDSRDGLANGWADQIRAKQVVFGENEEVVVVERFCEDPPEEIWPGHTHRSVCKGQEAKNAVIGHLG